MPRSLDQPAEEALLLPSSSRAELAEKLVASLEFPESDDVQAAWAREAVRRHEL